MSAHKGLAGFTVDLTAHEQRRLAEVLNALGENWDPAAVLAGEKEAHRQLYSNLNSEQQATYDMLVKRGVLPDINS